jgi:hypothetical protein
MKFTIHKKTLVKMLKVISGGLVKKDAHLRIAAQDGYHATDQELVEHAPMLSLAALPEKAAG